MLYVVNYRRMQVILQSLVA